MKSPSIRHFLERADASKWPTFTASIRSADSQSIASELKDFWPTQPSTPTAETSTLESRDNTTDKQLQNLGNFFQFFDNPSFSLNDSRPRSLSSRILERFKKIKTNTLFEQYPDSRSTPNESAQIIFF